MQGNKANVENLFVFLVVALVMVILLGSFLYMFGIIDDSIAGQNIVTNNGINISQYGADTFGKINSGFLNNADLIGVFFLFGVAIAIMFSGYLSRNETPRIFFVIEIIVTILVYIPAVYISNSYETILPQLPFLNLIASNLNNTSTIVLNLPLLTIIVASITMILTYSGIPKREEEAQIPGF